MNILFFTCWYPNKYDRNNGIFVKEHAKCIKYSGNKIIILSIITIKSNHLFKKEIDVFSDENGIETHIIYIKSYFYKWIYINLPLQYYFAFSYFKKTLLSRFTPDVIHSNIIYPAGIIGNKIAKKINTPHYISEHWSKLDKFFSRNVYRYQAKKTYNNSKKIVVVSNFLMEKVRQYTLNKNIFLIPNIISDSYKFKLKILNETQICFCAIATWKYPKLPFLIMDVLNYASKNISQNIILNFIGEGPLLNEMKSKSKIYNFEINFHGYLDKPNICDELQRTNYFIHASEIETFSIVIAEALATGTPVIASNVGAIPNLINEENGILCNNTITEWTEGILKLIKTPYNHENISNKTLQLYSQERIRSLYNILYKK